MGKGGRAREQRKIHSSIKKKKSNSGVKQKTGK